MRGKTEVKDVSIEEVISIIRGLYKVTNRTTYKFGIAGSFSRGEQKENSDVDVVIGGVEQLSLEEFENITNYLDNNLNKKYDILVIEGMKKDDKVYDRILENMGLPINEDSAYKNIKREVRWIE